GDAAHLFTPLGGLGMNTGIGDVMNLCWKLAAVRQGWAGPRLIESYETERRPMGVRNSQLGVRCTRIMDGRILPKNFEDDGATADAARRVFGAKIIREDRPQYLTVGIQLGERYEPSPIVWPDEDDAPPDTWDTYTPIDRPGARAPHFWLTPGRAAYDEFGKGFTLLDFGAPEGASAIEAAARERRVPLKILRLEPPAGLYRRKLVLIRPDQHIAWHGHAVADATAVIDRVRGAQDLKTRGLAEPHRAIKPLPCEQFRQRSPVRHNPWIGLHNPVMLPYRLWPSLRFAGKGEKERREPTPRRLSRPRPQCGFSSAQLLPAVAVVVAGRHQ